MFALTSLLLITSIYLNESAMTANNGEKCHLKVFRVSNGVEEHLADVKAHLLSDKPDCSVFRVTNRLKFNNNLWDWFNTAEVIKIVRMVQKQGAERKPMELLAHEVDMFELVKSHKSENVIKVHAAHVFSKTIYMRMELGEFELAHKLKHMGMKWQRLGPVNKAVMVNDIFEMIDDMATVLADFNRYAIHFALKTENWVYVKVKENGRERLKLKLIDLQTAATTANGKVQNPVEQSRYFCKQRKGMAFVPSHASPEHINFCDMLKKEKDSTKEKGAPQQHSQRQYSPPQSLPELTAKADIWSMGVVICEILAQTPYLSEFGYENVKAVFVPMPTDFAKPSTSAGQQVEAQPKLTVAKSFDPTNHEAMEAQQKMRAAQSFNPTKGKRKKTEETEEMLRREVQKSKVERARQTLEVAFPFISKLLKAPLFQLNYVPEDGIKPVEREK